MTNLQASLIAGVSVLVVVLAWHAIVRDREVRRTRWGVFVERDRYSEDSIHSFDPFAEDSVILQVPAAPPPAPAPPDEEPTKVEWPGSEQPRT